MGLGVIVIANDFTALNVALPAIEEDLNVDLGTAQWVSAYCGVRDGDRHRRSARRYSGRRRAFVGSALFAGFSLLGGLAQDAPWLIAARGGHGPRRRADRPAILGMTCSHHQVEKRAGGLILGVGNAMGRCSAGCSPTS